MTTRRGLRWDRTRACNIVREQIRWMLAEPAPFMYNGLPSWWGFWSDALKTNTIEAVRKARAAERAEAAEEGRAPLL